MTWNPARKVNSVCPGWARIVFAAAMLLFSSLAFSQELDGTPSYTYAVFGGTGIYDIDDRRVYVLRVPARYSFRQPSVEEFGIKLLLPVTLGFHDIDNVEDFSTDSFATVAFVPGLELDFMPTEQWSIKPFGQAGYGWELDSGDTDVIWGAGIKTRYELRDGDWRTWLGAEYLLAGKSPTDTDPSTSIDRVSIGIDVSHPIKWSLADRRTSIHGRVIYRNYTDELVIKTIDPDTVIEITEETEIALAVGVEPAIKFIGIPINQLGIGVRFGDYNAVTLATTFPF